MYILNAKFLKKDYGADKDDELSFQEGAIIYVRLPNLYFKLFIFMKLAFIFAGVKKER